MPTRALGSTTLEVSALGLGCGRIGDPAVSEARAEVVLRTAVELGVTLFDTARSYGESEERIGRALGRVRDEILLSTKLGYGIDGIPDWTAACVRAGVDAARDRLRTDTIDIVHLHSCPLDVLARGEVIDALVEAKHAGKIRVVAYAGDNDALRHAIADARIGIVQTSVNPCDPWAMRNALPSAMACGVGVIAKRPLANGFWRFDSRPTGHEAETYWERAAALGLRDFGMPMDELCLRFSAYVPGVHVAIVGTADIAHLARAVEHVRRGPLPDEERTRLQEAIERVGTRWSGKI